MKRLTIITICKNAEKEIERTIRSVVSQTFSDIQYIIKDAMSVDGTNRIVMKWKKEAEKRGIEIKYIQSRDKGIYHAMNMALEHAEGEWCLFLNAGDRLYDENVLTNILRTNFPDNISVVYGHTLIELSEEMGFVQIHNHLDLENRFSLGHQSCFVRTEIMKQYQFDETYKIAADYELFYRLFKAGEEFVKSNCIVSIYDRNGISAKKLKINYYENWRIRNGQEKKGFKFYSGLAIWEIKKEVGKICPFIERWFFVRNNMKRISKTSLNLY